MLRRLLTIILLQLRTTVVCRMICAVVHSLYGFAHVPGFSSLCLRRNQPSQSAIASNRVQLLLLLPINYIVVLYLLHAFCYAVRFPPADLVGDTAHRIFTAARPPLSQAPAVELSWLPQGIRCGECHFDPGESCFPAGRRSRGGCRIFLVAAPGIVGGVYSRAAGLLASPSKQHAYPEVWITL